MLFSFCECITEGLEQEGAKRKETIDNRFRRRGRVGARGAVASPIVSTKNIREPLFKRLSALYMVISQEFFKNFILNNKKQESAVLSCFYYTLNIFFQEL